MSWVVGLVLVAASASEDLSTVQRIHELEWERAQVVFLAPQLAGADAQTRIEGVRALGRLRTADALPHVLARSDDPERDVRREAARALGFIPDAAPDVRRWLATERPPRGLAARAAGANGILVALIESLGQVGTARDVEVLAEHLAEPWPVGAAAARALGRLGVREQPGADEAVPHLVDRLHASDPRVVEAVAWALSRIGMDPKDPAVAGAAPKVVERLGRGTTPRTRAWLVRAVWPALSDDDRDRLFESMSTDRSRLVRVAALAALQEGHVSADVVSTWLADPDSWVRVAALRALGRDGSPEAREALTRHAGEALTLGGPQTGASEAAEAIVAGGLAEAGDLDDLDTPPVVRAALAGLVTDPAALVALALDDPQAGVRSSASAALLSDDMGSGVVGAELMAAADPAVREVASELIDRLPARDRVGPLLLQLRVESDEGMVHVLLTKLLAAHQADGRAITRADADLSVGLRRGASARSVATRALALSVAEALGVPTPDVVLPDQQTRDLLLPGGDVVTVAGGWPVVAEARRIRGATVRTSAGTFQLQLDPDTAPLSVANFADLAESGFYDGLVVHRVEPGFVVQSGCPRGDGWGGPGWSIPDERSFETFGTGALGMARSSDPDTGGSQWFVTTSPQPHLDTRYTRFGHVVQGMHVVHRLAEGGVVHSIEIERIVP